MASLLKLVWPAFAWIGGVASYAMYGGDAWPFALALGASLAAAAVLTRHRWPLIYALMLPAVFALALWRADAGEHVPAADAVAQYNDGVAMRIRGVVRDDPDVRDTSQRFAVAVEAVRLRGAWRDASGGVLVTTMLLPKRRAGDVLELEGFLESPPEVPGFDYGEYLARRGIESVMAFPSARAAGHEEPPLWRNWLLSARRELSGGLALALPEPEASLAQGVLLGERSALPRDLSDDLNISNTSHLVVVSGSNVVLVASYATLALTWLLGRRRAMLLSIVAVLGYAALVGFDPPVARATIMGLLLVIAGYTGRRTDGLTSIVVAAAVMTAHDPAIIRDVSFQLSFAATAGIIWLAGPIRDRVIGALAWLTRRDEVPHWTSPLFAEPLAVTLAATIATTPLLGAHFGRLSLVAIPANALVVPAFPLILGASALAAIGGMIPHLHLALGAPAYALLGYWIAVARWFAGLPGSSLTLDGFASEHAALSYVFIGLTVIVMTYRRHHMRVSRLSYDPVIEFPRIRRFAVLAVPAAVLIATAGFAAWPDAPPRLTVTVMDVGQGDAILIETPSGRDVLVDGGPGRAVARGLGEELPWRDRSLDLVVVTHAQADHATGLLEVFQRYHVRHVLIASEDRGSLLREALREAIADEGAGVTLARAGDVIDLGEGTRLEVLWPPANASSDGNAGSVVLRLSWRDVSFLLTGDIPDEVERAVVESGVEVRATVLKVAHHGSAGSSSAEFLDAVDAAVAVVSAGEGNAFGHPAPDVVERLRERGRVYVTSDDGAVKFETDGVRLRVGTSR